MVGDGCTMDGMAREVVVIEEQAFSGRNMLKERLATKRQPRVAETRHLAYSVSTGSQYHALKKRKVYIVQSGRVV